MRNDMPKPKLTTVRAVDAALAVFFFLGAAFFFLGAAFFFHADRQWGAVSFFLGAAFFFLGTAFLGAGRDCV